MNVAIVTDSNTMIPWPLVRRLGITVVPLTVTIGGEELVEDEQLDVADAYRRLRSGEPATTSAPSPGAFAAAYAALAPASIVSVHIGSAYSGTLNAAQLGARAVGAEVRLVDTGTGVVPRGVLRAGGGRSSSGWPRRRRGRRRRRGHGGECGQRVHDRRA